MPERLRGGQKIRLCMAQNLIFSVFLDNVRHE